MLAERKLEKPNLGRKWKKVLYRKNQLLEILSDAKVLIEDISLSLKN